MRKSKVHGAFVLNHRVVLHAIGAREGVAMPSSPGPSQDGRVIAEK